MNSTMRATHNFQLLLCCLVLSSIAAAQDKKPLSPIPPDGFQVSGTWNCEGAMGNGKAHKSIFSGAIILDSKWIELTEQDVAPATGYVAKYLIGYDSQKARLVEFDANNFGAAIYTSGDGWNNRVLTMTSEISQDAKAPYVANRFLYSFTDKDTFTVDWQVSKTTVLEWKPGDHLVCRRRL
jgi:hypothetical protein